MIFVQTTNTEWFFITANLGVHKFDLQTVQYLRSL